MATFHFGKQLLNWNFNHSQPTEDNGFYFFLHLAICSLLSPSQIALRTMTLLTRFHSLLFMIWRARRFFMSTLLCYNNASWLRRNWINLIETDKLKHTGSEPQTEKAEPKLNQGRNRIWVRFAWRAFKRLDRHSHCSHCKRDEIWDR